MTERKTLFGRSNVDFTTGRIVPQLLEFAFPIVLGELLQNLYNTVDSLIVGNFVSDNALAAVSVCATLSNLLVGFFNGMSVGSSVIVARAFGRGNDDEVLQSMEVAFTFSTLLGVTLSVVGIFLTPVLVRISNVPSEVYAEAVVYLRIYLAGLLFTVIYNIGSGIVRAIGDSRTPFVILTITACVNVALDLMLVTVFPLGVAGVGIATVISQGISVLLIYRTLRRIHSDFRLIFRDLRRYEHTIWKITEIGIPSGIQYAIVSFSNLFVWRYISSFESAAAIAGIGVAQRLDRFVTLPCHGLGTTVTTCVGQNMGAKNDRRAKLGARWSFLLALIVVLVMSILIYIFAEPLVAIFNSEHDVVEVGSTMIRILAPFFWMSAIREVVSGILRAYGHARAAMVLTVTGLVVVRQIHLYYALRASHSLFIIYNNWPITWTITTALLTLYYGWMLLRRKL